MAATTILRDMSQAVGNAFPIFGKFFLGHAALCFHHGSPCSSSSILGLRPRFPFPGWFRRAQPQGDVRRLHRLLHHHQQLLAQLVQVHLLAQVRAKGGDRLGGVIPAAIEPPVDGALHAMMQRLEEGEYDQGRADQDERRLRRLRAEGREDQLRAKDQPDIQYGQGSGEQRIDQRASDKHIDIESIGIQHRHQEARDIDPAAKEPCDIDEEQGQRVCRGESRNEEKHQENDQEKEAQTHNNPPGGSSLLRVQETAKTIDQDPDNHRKAEQTEHRVEQDKDRSREEGEEHDCQAVDQVKPEHPTRTELAIGKGEERIHAQQTHSQADQELRGHIEDRISSRKGTHWPGFLTTMSTATPTQTWI